MNEKIIHESYAQEIGQHLQARIKRNGGEIYIKDVITEAKFCLVANTIISQRKLKEQTDGQMLILDPLTMEYSFEGMRKALNNLLMNKFTEAHLEQVKIGYENLLAEDNVVDLINNHYNDLYPNLSNNVL